MIDRETLANILTEARIEHLQRCERGGYAIVGSDMALAQADAVLALWDAPERKPTPDVRILLELAADTMRLECDTQRGRAKSVITLLERAYHEWPDFAFDPPDAEKEEPKP